MCLDGEMVMDFGPEIYGSSETIITDVPDMEVTLNAANNASSFTNPWLVQGQIDSLEIEHLIPWRGQIFSGENLDEDPISVLRTEVGARREIRVAHLGGTGGQETTIVSSDVVVEKLRQEAEEVPKKNASESTPVKAAVGSRPAIARGGQQRWKRKTSEVQELRHRLVQSHPLQQLMDAQLKQCTARRCKNQKRALLMYLHIATVQGVLQPSAFKDPRSTDSFFGWTGFQVDRDRTMDFENGLAELFHDESLSGGRFAVNTLHNMFRRAKLIPEVEGGWKEAFGGQLRFVFNV